MSTLLAPWLELSILLPLLGGVILFQLKDPYFVRKWALIVGGFTFLGTAGAWQNFQVLPALQASDPFGMMMQLTGRSIFVIDQLNAPLLPLVALLYFLTTLTTLRVKLRKFSFGWTLISESIVLAIFSCREPWWLIGLMSVATIPPWLELHARGKPTRVYLIYMGAFIVLLAGGWWGLEAAGGAHSSWAIGALLIAILIRSGITPFHGWLTHLFEHATFGTALLFCAPITGAYAALRLVLPIAPEWLLHGLGILSLVTAVYTAALAMVQREARRFFVYLFLSHSALVLAGIEMVSPIGLTGALCLWLSIGLSLGGFGLTLRALEARRGRLSLAEFQGLYDHAPTLAVCFMLTGLASVGFPGTLGFVGTELLVEGAVETYPLVGMLVVFASALNGIAVVQAYFILFTGTRHASTVSLQIGIRERFAVLALAAMILLGGFVPQPGVISRHDTAEELLRERSASMGTTVSPHSAGKE